MTTRILPQAEWSRLSETEIPQALPYLNPDDVRIVVVEDGDRIVGAWAVLRQVYLEGVWIAPEYRKRGTVAGRLLTRTLAVARQWAPTWAMTGATTKDVAGLLVKHLRACRLPQDTYVIPLREIA